MARPRTQHDSRTAPRGRPASSAGSGRPARSGHGSDDRPLPELTALARLLGRRAAREAWASTAAAGEARVGDAGEGDER